MNTKKKYTSIESKIVLFDHCDVITTSSDAPETPPVTILPKDITKDISENYK